MRIGLSILAASAVLALGGCSLSSYHGSYGYYGGGHGHRHSTYRAGYSSYDPYCDSGYGYRPHHGHGSLSFSFFGHGGHGGHYGHRSRGHGGGHGGHGGGHGHKGKH